MTLRTRPSNSRRIYVASSWRNETQPGVVAFLRELGHKVYDFRHPQPGYDGFHWTEIDPEWKAWSAPAFRQKLAHQIAQAGFRNDMDGLEWCDTCVLVLPCGRSAHLELGWAAGAGKHTVALLADGEPELMYLLVDDLVVNLEELRDVLGRPVLDAVA
jgi:nucleoside 2-deoxyribosyltransferase